MGSALCRNASPLAAARATFKRRLQERFRKDEPPVSTILPMLNKLLPKLKTKGIDGR